MSIKATTRVWKHSEPFKGNDKLTLLALADYADDYGVCWPGYTTIANLVGIEERSAKRIVKRLEEAGALMVWGNGGRGNSNLYFITCGLTDTEIKETIDNHPSLKGDTRVTVSDQAKGDTRVTVSKEKVTHQVIKGDTGVTRTVIEPPNNNTNANGKPQDVAKPKRKPATERQLMFVRLSEVCRYRIDGLSDKQRGRIANTIKRLEKMKVLPDAIPKFGEYWYKVDWRGATKNQAPNPEQIPEEWGRFEAWQNSKQNKTRLSAK